MIDTLCQIFPIEARTWRGRHLDEYDFGDDKVYAEVEQMIQHGRNLDEAELRAIEPKDVWIVSLVDSLDTAEQDLIGKAFKSINFGDYVSVQRKVWYAKTKEFLRGRLGRDPTDDEVQGEYDLHHNSERYKLCYILENPENMVFIDHCRSLTFDFGSTFLVRAQRFDPRHYPYLERILDNTLKDSIVERAEVAAA